MPKQKLRIAHILLFFFFIAVIIILMFRTPFGIDVTDISFWTAEPYLITQGAIPYVNNWSQTPLTSLVIAPLVWFFTTATGGTEGVPDKVQYPPPRGVRLLCRRSLALRG
jgi:hypothetical protein